MALILQRNEDWVLSSKSLYRKLFVVHVLATSDFTLINFFFGVVRSTELQISSLVGLLTL